MKSLVTLLMIIAVGIMLSGFAEAQGLSADIQKVVVNNSLKYVLETTKVSPLPQTVVDFVAGPFQVFKPVEKMSANGIKFTTWPIKVKEGSGTVLASQNLFIGNQVVQQKYAVKVSYTVYVYYNETNDLKFEVSDVMLLSSTQISMDTSEGRGTQSVATDPNNPNNLPVVNGLVQY
jgi:hypothetical protein